MNTRHLREKGNTMKYVVASGNPFDGYHFTGPFGSALDAVEYGQDNLVGEEWRSIKIVPPKGTRSEIVYLVTKRRDNALDVVTVHRTNDGALGKAINYTNEALKDAGSPARAEPLNWQALLNSLSTGPTVTIKEKQLEE